MTSTPFVTLSSTPTCDSCHTYYSSRFCVDCSAHFCYACNTEVHFPIGKRNHERKVLYGVDEYAHLEGEEVKPSTHVAVASTANVSDDASSTSNIDLTSLSSACTYSPSTSRLTVSTNYLLPLSAASAWDLLGDFDAPFLPFPCDLNDKGDRRVLAIPQYAEKKEDENEEAEQQPISSIIVTERLIHRSDDDHSYEYSRIVPPQADFAYVDMNSKFGFANANSKANDKKQTCSVQWTTTVTVKEGRVLEAAQEVENYQNSWNAYFDAAIESEE